VRLSDFRTATKKKKGEAIMLKSILLVGTLIVGAAVGGVIGGPVSAPMAQSVGSGTTGGSVAFVRDAGNAGYFEIQSGRLALEKSNHAGVRGYATQVVKDASDMVYRVKGINESNVSAPMPSGVNANQQAMLNRLAGLSGPDFDREYMRQQVEISDYLAKTFRAYGANGESQTLRTYAAKTASDYDAQLLQARTIAGSL
jgi:putative membrane protein